MKNILFAIAFIFCVLHTYGQEKFVRDVDGNRYKVLTYGSQLWLQENMRSTHDRDGNAFVTQDFSNNSNLPSMYVPGGNEKNVATYGLLYNWEAAQKVCPQGWRLPSVEDWRELVLYLSHDEKNCCGGEPKPSTAVITISATTQTFGVLPRVVVNTHCNTPYAIITQKCTALAAISTMAIRCVV